MGTESAVVMGVSCVGVVSCVGFGGLGCLILKGDSSCSDTLRNMLHLCANKQSRVSPYAADPDSIDPQPTYVENPPTPLVLDRDSMSVSLPAPTSLSLRRSLTTSAQTSVSQSPRFLSQMTPVVRMPLSSS